MPLGKPIALITGANRGIGLGFAKVYLAEGWRVIAAVRNPDNASDLKAMAADYNNQLSIHHIDLADLDSIEALAAGLQGIPIDVLLGNAAKTKNPLGEFGDTDYEDWIDSFKINCMAQLKLAESFVGHVQASQQKKMYFVSSRIGARPPAGLISFRSSKSALNQVVMQLSLILAPRGIAVACGHPGFVRSKSTMGIGVFEPEESAGYLKKIIDDLTVETAGQFFEPDGSTLPIVTQQTNPQAFGAKNPKDWDRQAEKREQEETA